MDCGKVPLAAGLRLLTLHQASAHKVSSCNHHLLPAATSFLLWHESPDPLEWQFRPEILG